MTRPFDFMVAFWGEEHRPHFVDLCLPSYLAPHNLPLLRAEDGHRFLIATTAEDWAAVEHLPIMERLRAHAEPTLIEVGLPSSALEANGYDKYSATMDHQNYCFKKLFETAYQRRSYGSLMSPDIIISDGLVATMMKLVNAGYLLAVAPNLRQAQERVLDELRRSGELTPGLRLSLAGEALQLSHRRVADLVIRCLHPEMEIYDQDKAGRSIFSPFVFWRVNGGRGIILHTFFPAMPFLIDFQAVPDDHADYVMQGLQEVYFGRNFSDFDRIHVVQDSDEFALVSLAPEKARSTPHNQGWVADTGWRAGLRSLVSIRKSMQLFVGDSRDVFRRELFRLPIRWHVDDLDEVWSRKERRVERLISLAVGDYYKISGSDKHQFPTRRRVLDLTWNDLNPGSQLFKLGRGINRMRSRAWVRLKSGVKVLFKPSAQIKGP